MPHLVLITPHYNPETGAAAQRCTALSRALAARGWNVTVLTTLPHHPAMEIPSEYNVETPFHENDGSVNVIRFKPDLVGRHGLVKRLLSEAKFSAITSRYLKSLKADIIVASSPYFFLGPSSLARSKYLKVPFVWDVRDLTWLYPRAAGKKTLGTDSLFDMWMRKVAQSSAGLVTTSEAQMKHLAPKTRFHKVIPNGVTSEQIRRFGGITPKDAITGTPSVTYVGLFGFMHGLTVLVETARILPTIDFHLYGDGPELTDVKQLIQRHNVRNVVLHGHVGAEGVNNAYEFADILVAPIRNREAFRMIQPAKIWEYLATGRPVIHAGNGESARILKEHQLAYVVEPENPVELANTITTLLGDFPVAATQARRAQSWIAANRNRELLAEDWHKLLSAVVAEHSER